MYLDSNGVRVPPEKIALKPQYFLQENTVDFLVDNIKEEKTIYYKAGVGVTMLLSNNTTLFGAVTQQKKWHELSNKTVYTNVSDDENGRSGISVLGALGLQKN